MRTSGGVLEIAADNQNRRETFWNTTVSAVLLIIIIIILCLPNFFQMRMSASPLPAHTNASTLRLIQTKTLLFFGKFTFKR